MRKDKKEALDKELADTTEWLALLAEVKEEVPEATEGDQLDTKNMKKYEGRHRS